MTRMDIYEMGTELANTAGDLAVIADRLNDSLSARSLRLTEPHLRQGVVRVCAVGITGSGKSTVINAAINARILPENPSVSSPIPVWIGYHVYPTPRIDVYDTSPGTGATSVTSYTAEEFGRKYCYNVSDILDHDRIRYMNVDYGAVYVKSDLLSTGAVLVDTLGVSAASYDSSITYGVLDEGMDIVVFVTKNNMLLSEEIAFLRTYILGFEPKARSLPHPVEAKNLMFLMNDFSGGLPDKAAFRRSVEQVFAGTGVCNDELERILNSNLFYVDALKARLLRAGGAYPYSACAPYGSKEDEVSALFEREEQEREMLLDFAHTGADTADFDGFLLALSTRIRELSYGPGSVVVRRMDDLIKAIDSMCNAANNRISAMYMGIAELEKKELALESFIDADSGAARSIQQAFKKFGRDYMFGFQNLIQGRMTALFTKCINKMTEAEPPESFDLKWTMFRRMDEKSKEEWLSQFLPDVISGAFECCYEEIAAMLFFAQHSDCDSPFEVLENARRYIAEQAVALNTRVQALKEYDIDALGISLPQEAAVDELFNTMQSRLETGVKNILSEDFSRAGKQFESMVQRCIENCRFSFFTNIFPHSRAAFWAKVQDTVFYPLLTALLRCIADYAQPEKGELAIATQAALSLIEDEIVNSRMELYGGIRVILGQLKKQILAGSDATEESAKRMEELKKECTDRKQRLIGIRSSLLAD